MKVTIEWVLTFESNIREPDQRFESATRVLESKEKFRRNSLCGRPDFPA